LKVLSAAELVDELLLDGGTLASRDESFLLGDQVVNDGLD